jgi:hypothetical protein
MKRAEIQGRNMKFAPLSSRLSASAKAVSVLMMGLTALAATAPSSAQTKAPAGSPADVRYTPVQGTAPVLYPWSSNEAGKSKVVPTEGAVGADYANNATVGRLIVEVERNAIPADGQTAVNIKVRVLGRDGQPLQDTVFITVEHSGGRILLPTARTDELGPRRIDADRTVPGVQVKVDNGTAEFKLLAPFEAQDVRLRVTAGSEEASGSISYVPELRPMIAAGLIEGIVNLRGKTQIDGGRRADGFEREINAWSRQFNDGKANVAARAAFFLKGTVRGDVLLTAGYDSDKETRSRLLRDINPDEFYPVYGDASLRSVDGRSSSKLYVRVDRNKDYVLFGDFVTGDGFTQAIGQGAVASLKQRSLGNVNRTATGVRAHHERDRITANVFAFNDNLRQVVEEFASQGSGPYGLRNNGVLEGSEKLEMVVRDRTQPARIIAVKALQRLVDYGFEPFSGRIVLFSFLPAVDENLNPVSLRASYEVEQGGDKFWVGGGDVQFKVNDTVELGASGLRDQNALSPYQLFSANATWKLAERTAIVAELAQTRSSVNSNPTNINTSPSLINRSGEVTGQAWRVEMAHEGERTTANAFIGRSEPAFNNPAAPLNGGRGEAQGKLQYAVTDSIKLYGEGTASEDRNPGGGERKTGGVGLRWLATERLTVDAGLRSARETVGTSSASSGNGVSNTPFASTLGNSGSIGSGAGGGALGYGNQALDPVTGLPILGAGGLAAAVSNLTPGTRLHSDSLRLGAGYRISERITLGGEVEHEVSGDARRRISLGGDVQVAERTKLYARWERQTGWVNQQGVTSNGTRGDALVAGVDTSYLRDTQLFSEYRLRDAISGRDLQLASGVRNGWDISEGLRVNTALEHTQVLTGQTASAQAASVGVDYSASELWRASTRLELRRAGDIGNTPLVNESFTTTLWQVMLARKLDRDWTLLGRNYLLRTDYVDRGDVLQNRAQLGLAYRDTDTNKVNALAKIEFKQEADASNATVGELKTRALMASSHFDYHPSRPWWLTGRVAGKWQSDRFEFGATDNFRSQLVSGRVVYDITENWDLGAMLAAQTGRNSARQTAVGVEVGYLLRQNLWLSAGFNATGFKGDADLTGYEYTQRGAYLRLRFKFDEDVFKGTRPAVNRSLERQP